MLTVELHAMNKSRQSVNPPRCQVLPFERSNPHVIERLTCSSICFKELALHFHQKIQKRELSLLENIQQNAEWTKSQHITKRYTVSVKR